jgi:hypothetical protein
VVGALDRVLEDVGLGEEEEAMRRFFIAVVALAALLSTGAVPRARGKTDFCKLRGRVKFVTSGEDYRIRIVDSLQDARVRMVEGLPQHEGEWRRVDSFPDFRVRVVDFSPDFKVRLVDSFPGCGH